MDFFIDNQMFKEEMSGVLKRFEKITAQTTAPRFITQSTGPEQPPAIITKKWLAARMGCTLSDGRISTVRFYRSVLTTPVLDACGLSAQQVRCKGFKEFTRQQSVVLIEVLQL